MQYRRETRWWGTRIKRYYGRVEVELARGRILIFLFQESLLLEPMYDSPGSSVRYVLIDRSVVLGERPAHYWSRSEGASFYGMLAAEEELWEAERRALYGDETAQYEDDPEASSLLGRKPTSATGSG
jgi:hypothetical protein